jgi:hypothetical protein
MSHFNRRRFFRWGLAAEAHLVTSSWFTRAAAEKPILAGVARADITPALPAFFDLGVVEIAHKIGHPLFAKIFYVEQGDEKALFIAADMEGYLRTAYSRIKNRVVEATGLVPEQIVINSSHSHNAMWVNLDVEALLNKSGLHLVDVGSFDASVERIARAAKQAVSSKQPVKLFAGEGRLPELAWNRRTKYLSDEEARRFNRRRQFPIGTTDPTLGVVRAQTASGRTLAVLCFYASHATVPAGGDYLSGSYPGAATAFLERRMGPPCTALFFQGCAGNIAPKPERWPGGSPTAVDQVGAVFAERVWQILQTSMQPLTAPVKFGHIRCELPLEPLRYGPSAVGQEPLNRWFEAPPLVAEHRQGSIAELQQLLSDAIAAQKSGKCTPAKGPWILIALADRLTLAQNLPEWSRYDLQAFLCGQLCLVFIPGETYVDIALEIKQKSGFSHTFVSAYNDCTPVYVPDPIAFEEGGYETGPWCYSTPDTGHVLVTDSVRLIKSLSRSAAG